MDSNIDIFVSVKLINFSEFCVMEHLHVNYNRQVYILVENMENLIDILDIVINIGLKFSIKSTIGKQ